MVSQVTLKIDQHKPVFPQVSELISSVQLSVQDRLDLCCLIEKRLNCFGIVPILSEKAYSDYRNTIFLLGVFNSDASGEVSVDNDNFLDGQSFMPAPHLRRGYIENILGLTREVIQKQIVR